MWQFRSTPKPTSLRSLNIMQTNSDVILRSSDGDLFYSLKALLSISSAIFRDMFTLPQPVEKGDDESHWHNGLPVVSMGENSHTLGNLLSLCHPPSYTGINKEFKGAGELREVLEATIKYDMEKLRSVALKELANPSFLSKEPLRIYALACKYECDEAARLAAKHTLTVPLSTLTKEYVPELENIHADKLWRLFCYREAAADAACSLAVDHKWIIYSDFSPLFGCQGSGCEQTTVRCSPSRKYPKGRTEDVSAHTWWLEYMRKSGGALQRSPHKNSVKDKVLMKDVRSALTSSKCEECKESPVWETFQSFVDSFADHIERRVEEVHLVSPLC